MKKRFHLWTSFLIVVIVVGILKLKYEMDKTEEIVQRTKLFDMSISNKSVRIPTFEPGVLKEVSTSQIHVTQKPDMTSSKSPAIQYEAHMNTNISEEVRTAQTHVTKTPDMTSLKTTAIQNEAPATLPPFCASRSEENKNIIIPDKPSNLSDWTFQKKRKCPHLNFAAKQTNQTRLKYSLQCSDGHASLVPSITNRSDDVDVVNIDSPCLSTFISTCCTRDDEVPNVVHYVFYFNKTMRFDFFANVLSVIRFVRPCVILIHGDYFPYGKYWNFIIRIFPNILHVKRPRPLVIHGKKVRFHEHSGDVMRLEALQKFGGVYLDLDYLVLKNLQPFANYATTLCDQQTGVMLNCFIMAKKNATFISLWMEGYKDFRNDSYWYNSMLYNGKLAREYPHLVHIEKGTLCVWKEFLPKNKNAIEVYKWPGIFGFHLFSRTIRFTFDEWTIRSRNSTLASLTRHVVYGNKDICE